MQNDLIRHTIYVNRFGGGLYNKLLPDLKRLRDDLILKVAGAKNLREQKKLSKLLNDIRLTISSTIPEAINPELFNDFAVYENEHALKLLDKATVSSVTIGNGLQEAQMLSLLTKSKLKMAGKAAMSIDAAVKVFSDRYYKDIKSSIELGLLSGDTNDKIVESIDYLSNNRTRQQAEALVRTLANHTGTVARTEAFSEYKHLFVGEKYVTALDSRVSPICISLADKIFPFNEGPYPPQHYNCRSVRIAQLKPEYDLKTGGKRSSSTGPVSSDTTYNSWLKSQNAETQNEILGLARAKSYRKSGKPIDKFIDRKGKYYT